MVPTFHSTWGDDPALTPYSWGNGEAVGTILRLTILTPEVESISKIGCPGSLLFDPELDTRDPVGRQPELAP